MKQVEKCKKCDAPKNVSKLWTWYPNGVLSDSRKVPFIMMGVDELLYFFQELEKRTGAPVGELLKHSKYWVTIRYMEACTRPLVRAVMKEALKGIRKFRFSREKLVKTMAAVQENDITALAWGVMNKEECNIENGTISVVLRNPYPYPDLAVGALTGGYAHFMDWPSAKMEWEMEGDDVLKFWVSGLPNESELKKYVHRMRPMPEKGYLPGKIPYAFCSECGFPKEVWEKYRWYVEKGELLEVKTGKRHICIAADCFNSLWNTVEGELGNEAGKMMVDLEKEYIRKDLEAQKLERQRIDYQNLLSNLPMRGLGYAARIEKEGEKLQVQINNCIHAPHLAGMIGGFYEYLEGKEAEVNWARGHEELVGIITVVPKKSKKSKK